MFVVVGLSESDVAHSFLAPIVLLSAFVFRRDLQLPPTGRKQTASLISHPATSYRIMNLANDVVNDHYHSMLSSDRRLRAYMLVAAT